MGSHLSCIYVTTSSVADNGRSSPSPAVKIVLASDGRTCELEEPMKVAELMLEFPNHFVVEYDLQQLAGKRVSPLPADHATRAYHVYFLLSMHRLNTRLSAEELDRISALASTTASSATARATAHVSTKVTPLSAHQYEQAEMGHDMLQSIAKSYSFSGLEVLEEDAPQQQQPPQLLHAMLRSRSWTPKLDTIVESSPLIM